MARHRNVRGMDFNDEYEGYFSCYGHSVEDDICISPHTEAQFLYDRNKKQHQISAFLSSQPSVEEEAEYSDDSSRHNSFSESLNPMDFAKMQSCIEAIQNVVGDTIAESLMAKAIYEHNYDVEKALDAILSGMSLKPNHLQRVRSPKKEELSNSNFTLMPVVKTYPKPVDCPKEPVAEERVKNDYQDLPVVPQVETGSADCINNIPPNTKPSKDILDLYESEHASAKPLLNLIVVGHVDAGKSTLLGHLLFKLGYVSKKTMHKYEQDAKKMGKASFMYAWVLDETDEERKHGVTMDVAHSRFETENRIINLLDAPGHKDFIPNMITGAVQADVAVLVIDATRGEFETGFETGGQTREHTMLIRSLGVTQLAVAVNKMDNVEWDKKRYDHIVIKLSLFLKQAGFKDNDIWFVPCSGLTGDNVTTLTKAADWYNGTTLLNVIDAFSAPDRPILKPLRMSVTDIFKKIGGGICISGLMETGYICNGDKVLVMPSADQAVVRGMTVNDTSVQHSYAGDDVVLNLSGMDPANITCGSTICDISLPIKISTMFEARLVIFNIQVPITKGFPVILHYRTLSEQAVIKKISAQLNKSTGLVEKKKPRCLLKNSSAIVEIEVSRPIALELHKDFKNLGRFMLRSNGSTIAAGLVTKIIL